MMESTEKQYTIRTGLPVGFFCPLIQTVNDDTWKGHPPHTVRLLGFVWEPGRGGEPNSCRFSVNISSLPQDVIHMDGVAMQVFGRSSFAVLEPARPVNEKVKH